MQEVDWGDHWPAAQLTLSHSAQVWTKVAFAARRCVGSLRVPDEMPLTTSSTLAAALYAVTTLVPGGWGGGDGGAAPPDLQR